MAKWLFIILTMSFLFMGGSNDPRSQMRQKIIVDITSNGKKIEINVGDEIQIELKSQGGTGYSWYFDELDNDFFELISEETKVIPTGMGDVAGNPVMMIWKLITKKSETRLIKASYYRIWEGKNRAINKFEIEVKINP